MSNAGETGRLSVLTIFKLTFEKLDPRIQIRNPVMFLVYLCSIGTTILLFLSMLGYHDLSFGFVAASTVLLWLTILFANLAEAIAEGQGKAQAATLRAMRNETKAQKIVNDPTSSSLDIQEVDASVLKKGDVVVVETGKIVPLDGEIIIGTAAVDESAITGESAPVIREAGGDRSAVTGGTTVISDRIIVKITAAAGEGFLDAMIALVEGAKRQKTPNEIALAILLAGMSLVFVAVCWTLQPIAAFVQAQTGIGTIPTITGLVVLFVCLAPTTIGALLSAIGIAGINRLSQRRVLALSGRAVEAAGDSDVLLLDKTGTITLGNRRAVALVPSPGVQPAQLVLAAAASSAGDETPEGRSVLELIRKDGTVTLPSKGELVPFSAETRLSGWNEGAVAWRKGAMEAVERFVIERGGKIPQESLDRATNISRLGGTPLGVCKDGQFLGVIHLKDVLKPGMKERFGTLRQMGIRTVMITGDNPLTAAAIAAEAGVDEFLAEATPTRKLALIREYQASGHLVAMTGDGTNDAPALAQADVAVAMNSGTQAAKEAANMVDLESDPTKLIDIVEIGKRTLMTRGSLTTFSIANDVAKYFAILPALFVGMFPALGVLDVLHLGSPTQALLAALIFNTFVIPALIPLALVGVSWRPWSANKLLAWNIGWYGLGGVVAPFIFIKLIDMALGALGVR